MGLRPSSMDGGAAVGGSAEAYHRQYHSSIEPEKVAEMLILHPLHPRSIRFSTSEVRTGLRALSGTGPDSYANEAERLAGRSSRD